MEPETLPTHGQFGTSWRAGVAQRKQNEKDRVLMICRPATAYGGGQQYIYRLLEAMEDRYNVLCVCPVFGPETSKFKENVEQRGGVCEFLADNGRSFASRFTYFLLGFRPKVVHFNGHVTFSPLLMTTLAVLKFVMGWKVCLTQHLRFASKATEAYVSEVKSKGLGLALLNQRWAMRDHRMTAWTLKAVDKIIFVNQDFKAHYETLFGLRRDHAVSIINGVDIEKYRPDLLDDAGKLGLRTSLGIGEKDFLVLGIGNLIHQKRFDVFIETIAALISQNHQVKGVIVGIGPLEQELKALAAKMNVEDAVVFAGYRKDIPLLLNVGDSLLMTSDDEGLPYILLESRAAGLPAVVTDVGGNKEVVTDGVDGFIVEMEDVPGAFAATERLIDDPEVRRSMSRLSREDTVKRFGLQQMKEHTMDVFQQMGLTA